MYLNEWQSRFSKVINIFQLDMRQIYGRASYTFILQTSAFETWM